MADTGTQPTSTEGDGGSQEPSPQETATAQAAAGSGQDGDAMSAPAAIPVAAQETACTKEQLIGLSTFTGPQRDLFALALKEGQEYTLGQALAEVENYERSLF